jgi:8-oxo-dGTP pyrophosphatase MutT (NUDIX family)
MSDRMLSIVAALIRDEAGRVLLVRKRGTVAFMQPGGKVDAGESDMAALAREIVEELGCCLDRTPRAPSVSSNALRPMSPEYSCMPRSMRWKSPAR